MISLFDKFKSKSSNVKNEFKEQFFKDSNHQWIQENKMIKRSFEILLESLNQQECQFFLKNKTYFIPCQAKLSCAIGSTKNHHLILVFPELALILQSASYIHGVSILAHELGHIFYKHTENKVNTLQAQIEADDFAFKLGFGEELQEILLDHVYSVDCRVRISQLTSKLVSQKYKKKAPR